MLFFQKALQDTVRDSEKYLKLQVKQRALQEAAAALLRVAPLPPSLPA